MSTDEQDDFVRLQDYAGFAVPKLADRELIERVYDACSVDGSGEDRAYTFLAFTPEELATHNRAFQAIVDDSEYIDSSMYDLAECNDFMALVSKLKQLGEGMDSPIVVPMKFSEWVTYSSYISHAFDLGDDVLTEDEEAAMSKVLSFSSTFLRQHA